MHILTIGSLNTHVQASIARGALRQLRTNGALPLVDVLALQEVRDPEQMLDSLQNQTGEAWRLSPLHPMFPDRKTGPRHRRNPALSYVATRDATMEFKRDEVANCTYRGKHLRQMPVAVAEHRASGKVIVTMGMHLAPGRRNLGIRAEQAEVYTDRADRVRDDRFGVVIGDWNETMSNGLAHHRGATSLAHQTGLRSVGVALGHKARDIGIDECWFTPRPDVRPVARREIRVQAMREKGGLAKGHPFLLTRFEIDD